MEQIINNGFTVYITKENDVLSGVGLKMLARGKGICPQELKKEQLQIFDKLTSISESLNNNEVLQMYRYENCYVTQIGRMEKEGPYGEENCFCVHNECASCFFLDALIGLDEHIATRDQESCVQPLKKLYRLYGMDKYLSHNMYF